MSSSPTTNEEILQLPLVRDFYANKEIFITGGTGYLGKVFIEKVLRSCPDVARIFILIRSKKGYSPATRLKLFAEDQVFDRLRKENPSALDKIHCVSGDSRELGLGIGPADFERIRKCSIVIHSAATVRFDELLSESILMNTRGTRETLLLAQRMDNVEIFNHVSTTFCNPDYPDSEEKLYPVHVYWKDAIKLAENLNAETLETVAQLYMDCHPNTYTFSKRLSEHLVNDLRKDCKFPVVILRPSVVTPTIEEPFPGWVDNFNGPTGLIVAFGTGIHRFVETRLDHQMDYQPVDVVAKSIILSTWKEAHLKTDIAEDVPIYNSSSYGKYAVTNQDLADWAVKLRYKYPLWHTLWYPKPTITQSHFYCVLMTIVWLAIPMNIIDFFINLFDLKISIRLSRLVRKIFYVTNALRHFMNTDVTFNNERCMALDRDLQKEEYVTFRQNGPVEKYEYMEKTFRNARLYLMKEEDSSIPAARRKMYVLAVLHYGLLAVVWGTVAWCCWAYLQSTSFYRVLVK